MTSALDKVNVFTGTPPCQPGKCIVCGNCGDSNTKFLDVGLEIDFYGVVYFCSTCLSGNILPHLELVPLAMFEKVQEELEKANSSISELKTQNDELRSLHESSIRLGFSTVSHNSDSSINTGTEQDVAEESESTDSGTDSVQSKTNRRSTRAKSGSIKQTDESGSTSVHSNVLPPEFDI